MHQPGKEAKPMQDDRFSPIQLLISCFGVSSLAGIAQAVRRGEPVHIRKLVGTGLYSGMTGLIVGMLLYQHLGDQNYILLLGVSGLAGLGGSTVLDFVLNAWAGGGIKIIVSQAEADDDDKKG
jgi:hypothetical protein